MISLKEFLHEQAAKEKARALTSKAVVDEWRCAVQRLFGQIRGWLADSDPEGVIQIEQSEREVKEEALGIYQVPVLHLRAFGQWVGIIPKAIRTIGTARPPHKLAPVRALGRVDITDEIRRFFLYRFKADDGSDLWMMDDGRGQEPKVLTQQDFETALMSYYR
jgi:hypothetical protein